MSLFGKKARDSGDPKSQQELRCSFCSKSQAEVAKLIAGPDVHICEECVDRCNDVLAEEVDAPETPSAEVRMIVPTGLSCGLCRFPVEAGGFAMVPDRGPLCAACLDAIRAVTEDNGTDSEAK